MFVVRQTFELGRVPEDFSPSGKQKECGPASWLIDFGGKITEDSWRSDAVGIA
jgi:hypothetical protein